VTPRARVLLLVTLAETGGAQTYVASLLPALVERYDVTVAAWGPGPLVDAARTAGADYVPLRHVRRRLDPVHDVLGLVELVRLCRRLRPHVVHANSSKAGILGRLAAFAARVPVRIFTAHGWAFNAHEGAARAVYLWADRLVRPLTTAVVCVAENERAAGVAARVCTARQAVVIRNAVDVAAARLAPGVGDPPQLLAVGRLKAPKDFVTFARAVRLLPPGSFRAAIAGDGPDRAAVEAELAGAAELLGERSDVPELLAAADVFVLPSRSEGLPLSVIEAMAAGLPVVASRVGGVPELVAGGETGMLVPPGDPEALAAALRALLDDAERRRALGAAGRRRAEAHFDLPAFRAAHVELYERLLGPYRSRR
jgi:glycosyltransferase involved in cell wall biosynthesis